MVKPNWPLTRQEASGSPQWQRNIRRSENQQLFGGFALRMMHNTLLHVPVHAMYVFTTLNTPTGSPPPPVHLTHYTHSSLNHKTCTSRGPSPSATNREQSIIPLKQLQKNYTQSKYLFVIWHQEQVYHKNINQPANWVGPIVSPHYHVRMHEWMIKKERKCILQFVCTYSRM